LRSGKSLAMATAAFLQVDGTTFRALRWVN